MRAKHAAAPPARLAEVMAALSLATDLGMGRPIEFALAGCVLATRMGASLGMSEGELRDVYDYGLLRYIGCNSETHTMAALLGDELAVRASFAEIDTGNAGQVLGLALRAMRQAHFGAPALELARTLARGALGLPQLMREQFSGHCEVAQRLAQRLGFGESLVHALGQLYERWDGRGLPRGLRGDAIAPAVLLVTLAQDAVIFLGLAGPEAAAEMVRGRRGGAYDPRHADHFCANVAELTHGLGEDPSWELVLASEPGGRRELSEAELDVACAAMADFADLKSPYALGHSPAVARLAEAAAQRAGLGANEAWALRRAGLLHDLGRVGVSAGIWAKPGPLTEREWEKVRLHPYYTERILARSPALAEAGAIAALHQERLDGSGYHRALPGAQLPAAARLLAAADVYVALTEPRPHRPARAPAQAASELERIALAGRLDQDSVGSVLEAAGRRAAPRRPPPQLTEREVEVLRLIARGQAVKQVARALAISPKTVDTHVQHIYEKTGVSTRAGVALYAVEHGLLADSG
jgi:HD-GYP domain-containing protein (c-di-GMP phosphodiesterase class II)